MHDSLDLVKQWLRGGAGTLVGDQGAVLGIDIGSYGLRAIAADLHGAGVYGGHRPWPEQGAEAATSEAIQLAREVLKDGGIAPQRLVRIGIGFGGPVDASGGATRIHHRYPGWEDFPLAERFETAFDAPTLLDNDANVIALGEACCIQGREAHNLFYLHLSTGVGGGMVLDGHLYSGATTTAAEIGHTIMRRDGPACSCGGRGHLEAFVSVGALLRRAGELGLVTDDLNVVFGDHDAARQVVAEATEMLGVVLANIVAVVDPQMIVVGGIVARTGGDSWLRRLSADLHRLMPPPLAREIPLVAATFQQESVAVGALAMAFNSLQE